MPTPTLRCADCEAYGVGNTYPFAIDYSDEHVIIKRYCFPCAAKRGLLRSGPLDHPQSCEIGGCRYQALTYSEGVAVCRLHSRRRFRHLRQAQFLWMWEGKRASNVKVNYMRVR